MTKQTVGKAKVEPKIRKPRVKRDPEVDLDDEGFNSFGVQVITPLSPEYQPESGRQGRPDRVSPILTPMLKDVLDRGLTEFQIPDGDPFTIYQVRGWAKRLSVSGALPDGVRKISVGGGRGSNIAIRLTGKKKVVK